MSNEHTDGFHHARDETVEYDPGTGWYRTVHDWDSDDSVSTSVVLALAAVTGRELTEIVPLSDHLDFDALNQLFEPSDGGGGPRTDGHVAFVYDGHCVVVHADGRLCLREIEEGPEPT
ncbi:HalOD1 output domain-containing protein [Halomarina halobia]|uniref:HalOD1 output domain-containing protein n=1 Tax=Halomarina halobia TaxID=3033386 RepID=A0ABD6ACT3_9EURY|nr:HalOD1 output domain-containing protein [Halomarina sp. PSR21]